MTEFHGNRGSCARAQRGVHDVKKRTLVLVVDNEERDRMPLNALEELLNKDE